MSGGRTRERSRDAPTRRPLHDRPRRAGAGARGGRVREGPGAAAPRGQERLLDAQVHLAAPRARADARRPHAGAHPRTGGLAPLRPRGRAARDPHRDARGRAHARRPDGQRAVHGRARQLGRRPPVARGLYDVVVPLRRPADHRLGGAADGLALRRRTRHPEPRLPDRGGLARRRVLPRVSPLRDLRELVARLEQAGRLRRVSVPVSRDLEITEITDRVSKGPSERNVALLFERVEGSDMPVLVNAFAAADRLALALGVGTLDELGERVAKLLDVKLPGTFAERLRKLGTLFDLVKAGPRRVTDAPCQEVVETERASLASLPVLRCWPKDGGRYITLPCVFTRDPKAGTRNGGMYRLQGFDDRTLGMHWQTHKGGAEHERVMTAATEPRGTHGTPPTEGPRSGDPAPTDRMPVAIALGGDPALIYAASAPLPPAVDEVVFAGWLRGSGVEMVACRTIDLEVPAQAEIVLEGYVDPRERRLEGPFGDHTGYYSLAREYPVFHLTAITRRARPIYPTTIVGRPPEEDYWLGKATERLFVPIVRLLLPEVVDINMPAEGVFHNLVIVSITKRYPGHARKVMTALWGMGLMMLAKTIVVVSEHVNVHDLSEVAWRATGNIDPRRDLLILEGPMDDLDHAALRHRFGGKLGVDATEKSALDDVVQPWPEEITMSDEVRELVTRRWKDYGL